VRTTRRIGRVCGSCTTIANLVERLLGRAPEVGDIVWWRDARFAVEGVEHGCATRVRMCCEDPKRWRTYKRFHCKRCRQGEGSGSTN
jgi:hypothetical protein